MMQVRIGRAKLSIKSRPSNCRWLAKRMKTVSKPAIDIDPERLIG